MDSNIIYRVTNLITNECYVGATTNSLEVRKKDHLQKSEKKVGSYFQQAIETYGPEAFLWEQIDTAVTINELALKEIKYIDEYNSLECGYNSDKGGGFKKTVYQYSIETGEIINFYPNLQNAANAVNANKKSISNSCLNYNKTCKGYIWSYSDTLNVNSNLDLRKKKVNQISLDGDIIACYESASYASRETGISKTCITRCCRGERVQSGGFLWKYS